MRSAIVLLNVLLVFNLINNICADFSIPDVVLIAYKPRGFVAYIPDTPGIQEFAFHAKLNGKIDLGEPGEFGRDVNMPKDGLWQYSDPNLQLRVNDVINYWVFVQFGQLGYRQDSLSWTVTQLRSQDDPLCTPSKTLRSGGSRLCAGAVLFEEPFTDGLQTSKWTQEQYITIANGPDYEFVQYTKDPSITEIRNNMLTITPKIENDEINLRQPLDMSSGCTKPLRQDCYYYNKNIIGPPITSGQMKSTLQFAYGRVEVKAELPKGDWIYPQIFLEDITNPRNKILIAYARGNENLVGAKGDDIGGSLLFAGPVASSREPERSAHLLSRRFPQPVGNNVHTFALNWSKDGLMFLVDGELFGTTNRTTLEKLFPNLGRFSLVLGVGVGGVNDFPDGYKSNGRLKPWENLTKDQMKNFYNDRISWEPTWTSPALKVHHVKITAL